MIFGAALLGPECRHGLSGERSSWLLFVVGLELPQTQVSKRRRRSGTQARSQQNRRPSAG
ncbi:hypothetical protein [Mycobacterium ulcerans]|uniref:hypothetical protein n=1 Tax=Mycobacterium ulcerans TaxID=1809 RepID=UPI000ADC5713|nr:MULTISPECIES: hypothetical protein [Mycobacterium ulcerans group]